MQYVKIIDQFSNEEYKLAYEPIKNKDFADEFQQTLYKIFKEIPYNESLLDEPSIIDVIFDMQDNGWNILESDYEGYDSENENFTEVIHI
jgi:hypothetical protein